MSISPALRQAVASVPMEADTREALRILALDDLACSRRPGWLEAFVRRAWSIVEPRPLVWNWHMTLICLELERVAAGLTRELVIEVPPGTAKSLLVSAIFPAALWLREPDYQVLALAHIPKNVTRDSRRHREIVTSSWYRGLVERLARDEGIGLVPQPDGSRVPWTLASDQNEKTNFENSARGARQVGTVGGGITGTRTRGMIVDDAYDAKEATQGTPSQVAERMAFVVDEYDSNWKNRIDPLDGWRVTIMQGLAEGDLADVLKKRGVRAVTLPMEYDPERRHPRDPRKVPGELLFPARFSAEWCAEFKGTAAGQRIWGPQYQQVRSSAGGKLFPRSWFDVPQDKIGVRRYKGPPDVFARGLTAIGLSVDCTFKDARSSDRVSVQAWGWREDLTHRYLLDRVADRMDILGTIAAITTMRAKWNGIIKGRSMVRLVLVEERANGPAVIQLLGGKVAGLIAYNPRTSKYARAQVTSYAMQSGNIWYPEPAFAPWSHELTEQHVNFTGSDGGVDDDVDAESQMVIYLDDADAQKPQADVRERMRAFSFLGG